MKITINFFIYQLFFISFSLYPLAYDNATYAAQQGKWKDAYDVLNNILVNAPDRADVLYDAGVAAYNLKHFDQSAAYFMRAAECSQEDNLRKKAYFNAGNALVDANHLAQALDQYEKVLDMDLDHEYARHNRERVKQMLKEQKKDQQQQQQDNDKKDQQEHENDQDKQDNDQKDQQQDKQDQSGDDKKDQNGNKPKQDKKNGSPENGSDKESDGDQGDDDTESSSKDTEGKNHRDKEKNQKKSADNQKRDGDHQPQEKSHDADNKSNAQNGDKHKKTPEKQLNSSDDTRLPSETGQEQAEASAQEEAHERAAGEKWAKLDPWLQDVLKNQEAHDTAINKQLMEAKIHQHGGKNGQNSW